ncbi:YeeE/YedE family protein [Thermosulfuriphilus ammonigenes]|uniref:YeeE/YedE family protein n=1 Tax=Thermosulfuriphilus ammonigenes TaxID=1936021 RepID=A0A6G7PXN7_9BACT|nr:YeeE/YedE thiosulfate transporter family protein [Thermosulfuriphilus ammonigenes]MBA2849380.1 hypothetical protein [Thermosulfuriphilus ammonigenes]QIJ72454.1 YeeE/YedE family protein [Thermosulfuriphilus ammonigenes]
MAEDNVLSQRIKELYNAFFVRDWSPLMGAILIAFFAVLMEAWYRPWGIVGGLRNWADWFFYLIGLYEDEPPHVLWFSSSVMNIGFIAGAFISALMSRNFAFRIPPTLEIIKGFVAGILMGIGASLAMGCNIGGFYVAIQNLAANGLLMFIGLIFGTMLGLKYLIWEMNHFFPSGGREIGPPRNAEPYIGVLCIVALFVAAYMYMGSDMDDAELMAGYLLIGSALGFTMHRSRLCMVNGLREPFMTGDAKMGKAVMLSIILGAIGVAILKYQGLRAEELYVTPTFGLGALLGGFIFGAAMVVAGGCGSGSLWRVGEGQLKLWIVAITFGLTNSIVRHLFAEYDVIEEGYLGKAIYLPDYLGYGGTLFLITAIMIIWYIIIDWNEETNKMVFEI